MYLARIDQDEVDWAIQYARIVRQGADGATGGRDPSMAANVEWIAARFPEETPIVLWAHNGHIMRESPMMGWHLADRFGADYHPVGFFYGDGEYTAYGPNGLAAYPTAPPPAWSIEHAFRSSGLSAFALDLRSAAVEPPGAWLAEPRYLRSIGALALGEAHALGNAAARYDTLIYFDSTTPTRLNPR